MYYIRLPTYYYNVLERRAADVACATVAAVTDAVPICIVVFGGGVAIIIIYNIEDVAIVQVNWSGVFPRSSKISIITAVDPRTIQYNGMYK